MANTITKTTVVNGDVNLIQIISVVGDGSGEETNLLLVDRSTFAPVAGTAMIVDKIEGYLSGFSAALLFDATADLTFARLPADCFSYDWRCFGGIHSGKAGAGANGDILISTSSLGAGDAGTFYLHMRKK